MDFKVGGTYRMSSTNFTTGNSHSFGGKFVEIKQENLPAMIPVEMCYLGWQESLTKLIQLVEPEIKEG